MAHDGHHAVGNQAGGGVGGNFSLALIVLGHDFHLFAQHAALGVEFIHHQDSRVQAGLPVGSQLAGMGSGHAKFDGVGRESGRGRHKRGDAASQGLHPPFGHEKPPQHKK